MNLCDPDMDKSVVKKEDVLDILFDSEVRLTPQSYIKAIKKQFSVSSGDAKKILQKLITDQELCYNYLYGATYVEKSFLKPVRISKHFIIKPPGIEAGPESCSGIEIIIEQGISFGSGQHPTTQLCLEAIDYSLFDKKIISLQSQNYSADIGTGSGVLALALCKAGISSCTAYEVDSVSVNEARKNVVHNNLDKFVQVQREYMTEKKDHYSIICANLRFPTLVSLSDMIFSSLEGGGIAILSGVRVWEKEKLITVFSKKGFDPVWQKDRKKWSAFVLKKNL